MANPENRGLHVCMHVSISLACSHIIMQLASYILTNCKQCILFVEHFHSSVLQWLLWQSEETGILQYTQKMIGLLA